MNNVSQILQNFAMNKFRNQLGNPIIANILKMGKANDVKGLETFATNYLKQQGRDFNTEFKEFMNNFNNFKS